MGTKRRAERRAKARRKRYLTYGLVGVLAALGMAAAFVFRSADDPRTPTPDLDRSRGETSAPVLVEEYGDCQ